MNTYWGSTNMQFSKVVQIEADIYIARISKQRVQPDILKTILR